LYPSIYQTVRDALVEDQIAGYRIPKKSTVFLCPYVTHRHPEFWEDPEKFDPDRFLPERSRGRPQFAYFPFMGGPHVCLGREMALLTSQIIVAMIVQAYQLRMKPGEVVTPEALLTVRPRSNIIMMTVHN
jgi:cytochrome P450